MDISPNFAGVLMGFTNAASNMCGFLAPFLAGEIITNEVLEVCIFIYIIWIVLASVPIAI